MPDKVTTGTRGAPDLNFDFLNEIQQDLATNLGTSTQNLQEQQQDLGTLLEGVNSELKETRKKKRDSDVFFVKQANDLAQQSDAITNKALQAAADPWNELKALFTDTPSVKEWAVRHNAVQNQLNNVKRRYATGAAEYNYEVGEIINQVNTARTRLALTQENIAGMQGAAAAVTTQIQARTSMFNQQMSTMLLPDLYEELKDPEGKLPKGMVRDRIAAIEKAVAEANGAKARAGKDLAEQRKLEWELLKKYPEFINTESLNVALSTGETIREPNTGIMITGQMAKDIVAYQNKQFQAQGDIIAELTTNAVEAQQATAQTAGMLQRSAGPGLSIFAKDEKGKAVGFNMDALQPEVRQHVASMEGLRSIIDSLDYTASTVEDGPLRQQTLLTANAMRSQYVKKKDELVKMLQTQATTGMADKQAIEAVNQYVEFGVIRNETGANKVLLENVATTVPDVNAAGTHGPGWGAGMQIISKRFQKEWDEVVANEPNIFGDGEEIDSKELIAALLAGNVPASQAGQLALTRAVRLTDPNTGTNAIQGTILNDWYEIASVRGLQELVAAHVTEPETVKALRQFYMGDIALSPAITNVQGSDGKPMDAVLVLFSKLYMAEQQLKKQGALPKDSNLVNEYRNLLMSDRFYQLPQVRNLTATNTEGSASLNRVLFNNQANTYFQTGLQRQIQSVPLENIVQAFEKAGQAAQAAPRVPKGDVSPFFTPSGQGLSRMPEQKQPEKPSLQGTFMQLLRQQ